MWSLRGRTRIWIKTIWFQKFLFPSIHKYQSLCMFGATQLYPCTCVRDIGVNTCTITCAHERWNTWLRTKHQLSIQDLTSWDHPTCPLAPLWLPTILRSSPAGLFGVSHPIRPLPVADQLYALSQWCSIYSAIHNTNPTHSLKFPLTFRNKMLNSLVLPNYRVCVFTVPLG